MKTKAQSFLTVLVILTIVVAGFIYFIYPKNMGNDNLEQPLKVGDCVIDYSSQNYENGIVNEIYQDYQGKGLAYKVVHNNDPKDFTISGSQTFKLTKIYNCQ